MPIPPVLLPGEIQVSGYGPVSKFIVSDALEILWFSPPMMLCICKQA